MRFPGASIGCGVLLGLVIAGCAKPEPPEVHQAGFDARAVAFQHQLLPRMIQDAREKFNPESVARDFSRLELDSSRLVLLEPTAVRVYFVASQGGFHSALGYQLEGAQVDAPGPYTVFRNAFSPRILFQYADEIKQHPDPSGAYAYGERSANAPVLPGDYVDLGVLPAGTQIIFFLVADAVNAPKGTFTTIPERNPDKLQHVVTVAYQDSPYLLLGFEDLMGGGDRTFNDVVFAVELSNSAVAALGDIRKQQEAEALLRAIARRKVIRARITTGIAVGLILGGPVAIWALRRYLRRRRIRLAYAQARDYLETANPREALRWMREGQRHDASGSLRARWADIEMQASKQLQDAGQLEDLFDHHPDVVLHDEAASLMVARAQLESDRTEHFQTLRGAWQDRETAPWTWLTLESDLLVKQDKPLDAESLLRQQQFAGAQDAVRLARLAELFAPNAPADAQQCLARAAQLGPNNAEVWQSRARIFEHIGRFDEADGPWRGAVKCSGGDPFHRDHYAEYLVRRGDYDGALACWRAALPPPTADTIWLKTFFWSRVAGPADRIADTEVKGKATAKDQPGINPSLREYRMARK
jgi:tetratricopeptide (TPR) repeat protein